MRSDELTVEVRNADLERVGILLPRDRRLRAKPAFNGAGEWTVEVPSEHPMAAELRKPGSGLIVTGPDDVLWSGPVTKPATEAGTDDPRGMLKATGVTDSVILADAAAWPQPSNPNATTQAVAYDARTGNAETLMHAYVSANIGPAAPTARRGRLASQLIMGTNLGRGTGLSKRARFTNLADLLAEIAAVDRLGFRVVQRGTNLVFEVTETADRTAELRLDIRNGGLQAQKVATTPPEVTRVYVAGQGEGAERTIRSRTSVAATAAEAEWGRVVERFKDQRQTDDLAELDQAGDEDLADGGSTATNVAVVPADDTQLVLGRYWGLGDRITTVIEGQETTSTITSAPMVDVGKGLRIGMGLGDPAGFSRSAALSARVDDTAQRVSALERNTETPVDLTALLQDVRDATPAGTYGTIVRRTSDKGNFRISNDPEHNNDAVRKLYVDNYAMQKGSDLDGTTNLDDVTEPGSYVQYTYTNALESLNYPKGNNAGVLLVFSRPNGTQTWQIYIPRSNSSEPSLTPYFRTYLNGWMPWVSLATTPRNFGTGVAVTKYQGGNDLGLYWSNPRIHARVDSTDFRLVKDGDDANLGVLSVNEINSLHKVNAGGQGFSTGGDITIGGKIRIPSTNDLNLSSTNHAFQIGSDTGTNLAADNNEIAARNNGAGATLYLNNDGGLVKVGHGLEVSGGLSLTGASEITGLSKVNSGGQNFEVGGAMNVQGWVHIHTNDDVNNSSGDRDGGLTIGSTNNYHGNYDGNEVQAFDGSSFTDYSVNPLGGGVNIGPSNAGSGDAVRLRGKSVWIDNFNTNSDSANVYMGGAGQLFKSTSVRAAKVAIEDAPADWADKVYNLRPRTWFDRGESERLADYEEALANGEDPEPLEPGLLARIPGFVVDEVEAAGLTEFVQYDATGVATGLAYDRFAAALVATTQAQKSQLDAQATQLNAQETQLASQAQQISELAAAVADLQNGASA